MASIHNPQDSLSRILLEALNTTGTGVSVTPQTVLGLPAVFAGTRLISGKVARLPCKVYRRTSDGSEELKQHQAARVINRHQLYGGWFSVCQTITSHAVVRGNGYLWIQRDNNAAPQNLVILDPDETVPYLANGILGYSTRIGNGERFNITGTDVLHIKNLSSDGLIGLPVIDLLRQALGESIQHIEYGNWFFANNCSPGVVIEFPNVFKTPEEVEKFKKGFEDNHGGASNANRLAILQGGAKLSRQTINNEEGQWLAAKEFDLKTAALMLGIPGSKLEGNESSSSYNSREADNQAFLDDSLENWLAVWEEQLNAKLLTEEEKDTGEVFIEFVREALTRADKRTENEILDKELNNGTITLNEYRRIKNRSTIGAEGDKHRMPVNLAFIEDLAPEEEVQPVNQGDETAPAPVTDEQAAATVSNDLKATVGGSQQVLAMQIAFASGQISRDAAIANATLVFGFTPEEANQLFPVIDQPDDEPQQQQGAAPEGDGSQEGNPAPVVVEPDEVQPVDDNQGDRAATRLRALLLRDVSRLFNRIRKSGGDAEHRAVIVDALSPAVPDIDQKLAEFFAQLREDRGVLDSPEEFLLRYCDE